MFSVSCQRAPSVLFSRAPCRRACIWLFPTVLWGIALAVFGEGVFNVGMTPSLQQTFSISLFAVCRVSAPALHLSPGYDTSMF